MGRVLRRDMQTGGGKFQSVQDSTGGPFVKTVGWSLEDVQDEDCTGRGQRMVGHGWQGEEMKIGGTRMAGQDTKSGRARNTKDGG